MYGKLLLAVFVLNLFAYLGCSTRVNTEQMRKDVDNVFTKDEYVKISESCLVTSKTGKEFGDCKDRIFFPKVEKYCSDNHLLVSDCDDFKKLVRKKELEYVDQMKDILRNRTKGNGG